MATQTAVHENPTRVGQGLWSGGHSPFGASYGKLMMWFFLLSDAFTFSGLLIAYGMIRITHEYWPNPEEVFNAFPGIEGHAPLVFVGLMTFILIISSVTMVLAVDAGHHLDRPKVLFYMFLTIIGGFAFLGCQAWEWTHLIEHGTTLYHNHYGPLVNGEHTEGPAIFGQLFFIITGFHGFHVFSGVIINCIIFLQVLAGNYKTHDHYEYVEKVGLYWHFVDLVWVFVFTFFYLI